MTHDQAPDGGAASGSAWFEDDTFWRDFYPFMFAEERFERVPGEVAQVLGLGGFPAPAGKAVLDLCCGAGRHAIPLAQRGLRVTGVDRTAFLLERARERARAAGVDLELVQADMREFRRSAAYDLAVSLFTSFGYFEAPEDDLRVLRNLRASLRPGGVLVMDVVGKEWLARNFQRTRSVAFPDGSLLIVRNAIVDDWTRLEEERILIRDDRVRRFRLRLSVYSGLELKDRLFQAGFATVALHGDLAGAPYGLDAARLVAVARAGAV